jgi:ABC-type antimicrobial peptide transport system permease subunit
VAAWLILKPLSRAIADVLPFLRMEPSTVIAGIILAVALGAIASAIPAWQSARLNVVEGLRA